MQRAPAGARAYPKVCARSGGGGSAPKEANPYGASIFWRTAAAKCDGDGQHRLTHFAASVHPEDARPL